MGTPGMRYSLVSREVIADSIETVTGAQGFDGVVDGVGDGTGDIFGDARGHRQVAIGEVAHLIQQPQDGLLVVLILNLARLFAPTGIEPDKPSRTSSKA